MRCDTVLFLCLAFYSAAVLPSKRYFKVKHSRCQPLSRYGMIKARVFFFLLMFFPFLQVAGVNI